MDRSRRATNPGNYAPNDTVKPKKERERWVRSKAYRAIQIELAEDQRRVAAIRKSETGNILNRLLVQGETLHLEDLSIAAWQRAKRSKTAKAPAGFGLRSGGHATRMFAPGEFIARAHTKWAQYGGAVVDIPAAKARLSQFCHACGKYTKQASIGLSVFRRVHECACGVEPVQADLYKAFLARFASSQGDVDLSRARSAWAGAVTLLVAAGSMYETRDGVRLRAAQRTAKAESSERVAAKSASSRSQDSARRSGIRPRGAEGESDRSGATTNRMHGERVGNDKATQRRSTPVTQGPNAGNASSARVTG